MRTFPHHAAPLSPFPAEAQTVTKVLLSSYMDASEYARVETFNNAPNDFDFEEYLAHVKAS